MTNKEELKGKAKEGLGKVTGDDKKELEGKAESGFGAAKEKISEKVDEVSSKINDKIDELKHKK